jgi:hypothetical protein
MKRGQERVFDDAERARIVAKGFYSVEQAAIELGYSPRSLRDKLDAGMIVHTRVRAPGATRDHITIPVQALEDFKTSHLVPLKDSVLA